MTQWHANGNFFELTKKHDVHTARLEAQWYRVHVVGIWRRFVAVDDTRLVTREAMRKEKQAGNSPGLLLHLERVTGVEPASSAWKAEVLPLNHTRVVVGATGFEPATLCSQSRCATKLRYAPEPPD